MHLQSYGFTMAGLTKLLLAEQELLLEGYAECLIKTPGNTSKLQKPGERAGKKLQTN